MSNPFKIKKLEEFTIKDCESYLASYPYGEHYVEVKKRLSSLKSGRIKAPEPVVEKNAKPVFEPPKPKPRKEPIAKSTSTYSQPSQTYSPNHQNVNTNVQSDSGNIGDTILSWIGAIVVVLIVGTIILFALDAILPEGTAEFISKYKYLIYPAGLALARWIDEKK